MTRFLCPLWNNIRLTFKAPPAKKVAVVVPLSSRPGLTEEEEISLAQLRHYLSGHDFHLLAPEGLPVDFAPEFTVHRLDDKYFGSGQAHALLQLSAEFYERFIDYEYIFIYHLDALVFSDELLKWCDAGYDFIGRPGCRGRIVHGLRRMRRRTRGTAGFV